MPTSPVIEIDPLLEPIEGDDPAGGNVPFDVREKLENARKEVDPADFAPDDPTRPETAIKADWGLIERTCKEVLTTTSKNLLIAARLTEALVRRHGYAGLRDGIILLRRLTDECWDRLYPEADEDGIEVRASAFNWLDEADRGARFPHTVRAVPVVLSSAGNFSWTDWRLSQDGKGAVTREQFELSLNAMPSAKITEISESLDECVTELMALGTVLNAKMGHVAPGMTGVRNAVSECRTLAHQILKMKGGGESAETADGDEAEAASTGTPASSTGGGVSISVPANAAASRADIYRVIGQCAAALQQLEPHSPIPYLLRRAVALGALPFPQLAKELVRDEAMLASVCREFGIEPPAPSY